MRSPASMPATMSVSIRSPTITVVSECASIRFRAERIIIGFGLPTKYGLRPVAAEIIAATAPVAGRSPSAEGPVTSGLVAMNRAPPWISRIACVIASNERGQIRLDALQEAIERDERLGVLPCCVVANLGTTSTGAIDPLNALADLCEAHQLWLHIDGAYGGFGWADERLRERYQGIERAHSLSLDSHKWLGVPYESGCLLVREQQALKEAFARPTPAYLTQVEDEHPHFSDLGMQTSRAPRALVLWAVLRSLGRAGVRRLVMRHRDLAVQLAAGIMRLPGMRILAPVDLSTVCFRYEPAWAQGDEQQIRACNHQLLREIQPEAFLSTTEICGHLALRACVLHPQTDWEDMRLVLDALSTAVARQESERGHA